MPEQFPNLEVVATDEWQAALKRWGVKTGYSWIAPPRGFWAVGKDTLVLRRDMWLLLKQAAYNMEHGSSLSQSQKDALYLGEHELGHREGVPLNDHPTGLISGYRHAQRVKFDVRAFTGLLRKQEGVYGDMLRAKVLALVRHYAEFGR